LALAEAEKEAEEEWAAHAAVDAEMEHCRVAAAATAEDSYSDISWSSDDPDAPTPEERAAEQRAIVLEICQRGNNKMVIIISLSL
jgi:hypothetical protein